MSADCWSPVRLFGSWVFCSGTTAVTHARVHSLASCRMLGIHHPEVSIPVDHPEVSTHPNPVIEDHHITDVLTTDVTPEDRRSYRDALIG